MQQKDVLDLIMEFEGGDISDENFLKLFAHLIKTRQAWSLQGFYGRTASELIRNGLISKSGRVNWQRYYELEMDSNASE